MTLVLLFSQVTEHRKRMLKFKYRFQKCEKKIITKKSCFKNVLEAPIFIPKCFKQWELFTKRCSRDVSSSIKQSSGTSNISKFYSA